jgi:hypothetical protein
MHIYNLASTILISKGRQLHTCTYACCLSSHLCANRCRCRCNARAGYVLYSALPCFCQSW